MDYMEYIRSPEWREKSRRFIERADYRCQRCSASGEYNILQVHHRHYETLGYEMSSDVEVLCIGCHKEADIERKARRKHGLYNGKPAD